MIRKKEGGIFLITKIQQAKFGDIFFAELSADENIQGGTRPVVIVQNNIGNSHSPTVEILPMSSQISKAMYMPTHVIVPADYENGLVKDSVVLAEQVTTINKKRLKRKIGSLRHEYLVKIGRARNIQSPFPIS